MCLATMAYISLHSMCSTTCTAQIISQYKSYHSTKNSNMTCTVQVMLLFLVLAVISDRFAISWSYTLLITKATHSYALSIGFIIYTKSLTIANTDWKQND